MSSTYKLPQSYNDIVDGWVLGRGIERTSAREIV